MPDPAFLFYPGDYLQDTQTLSEASQVAYDRIMCRHMKNMCITQADYKFLTKRLTDDQQEELAQVVHRKWDGTYVIPWVAESIEKRRAYSESRKKNRSKKPDKTSKTYVPHMVNEIENENEIEIQGKGGPEEKPTEKEAVQYPWNSVDFIQAWNNWLAYRRREKLPKYKSAKSETTALNRLHLIANGDEAKAIAYLKYSEAQRYQGIYPDKNYKQEPAKINNDNYDTLAKQHNQ